MICPNRNILDELIFELSELIDTLNNEVEITDLHELLYRSRVVREIGLATTVEERFVLIGETLT
jgi:hypothetical protein